MGRQMRLLFGISVFWLALSVLFDGVNTLILPLQLSEFANRDIQATTLGLLAGALVQPITGAFSDRLQPMLPAQRAAYGAGVSNKRHPLPKGMATGNE